jgi:hypothetical protein
MTHEHGWKIGVQIRDNLLRHNGNLTTIAVPAGQLGAGMGIESEQVDPRIEVDPNGEWVEVTMGLRVKVYRNES